MKKLKMVLVAVVLVLFGATASAAFYFYSQYRKVSQNPQTVSKDELKLITNKIGKYMDLPSGEDASLATVTDKEKLRDQPFFSKSENGDKVLIFTKARKAILYRLSTNKIIDVAPIYIGGTETANVDVATAPSKLKVIILNGSNIVGRAGEIEKKIGDIEGIEVVAKVDAKKNDYGETLVVDLNDKYGGIAGDVAQLLEGKVTTLPEGEDRPEADLVIIAGGQ